MSRETTATEPTRRTLLLGLVAIAALFVLQGVLGSLFARGTDTRTRALVENALDSIEQLSRIVYDVDQQRIALVRREYLIGGDTAAFGQLADELSNRDHDLEHAARAYEPLAVLPRERDLWQTARGLLDQYRADVLGLSHPLPSAAATARIAAAVRDYDELHHELVDLMQLNRAGAAGALDRLDVLQRNEERLQWMLRGTGLVALLLFGIWGARRITRYERDIAHHATELDARNRDLDAFAGRVAHDLRNALAPIATSVAVLRRSRDSPAWILEVVDRTERSSRRAVAIIDALLSFARSARPPEDGEAGALAPAVHGVIEELAPLAAHLDASTEVGALPDVFVRCSPGLLHVVLANLYGNAVKYLEGRSERRVRISATTEGTSCRIDIEDTGPGIPEPLRERIFEPFFRVEGTRASGTGIGLATVRRIVHSRGGHVRVESTEGTGSRFSVWLPMASSQARPGVSDRDDRHSVAQ